MKLNQATATAAAFLFVTLASSSLATSSHEELKDKIAPPLASKPDHYLRSHRMLQSSYDFPTTSSGSGSNCSTGSPCYAAARTAFPVGKALLGLLGLIPIACCAAARRKTEEEEEAAVEPAAEKAAAPPLGMSMVTKTTTFPDGRKVTTTEYIPSATAAPAVEPAAEEAAAPEAAARAV